LRIPWSPIPPEPCGSPSNAATFGPRWAAVGAAKTAANYAASLRASTSAVARGMTVTLWLDAQEHRWIQELSGMNLFAVIGGALHTPSLDGAILPGVTRDSLLKLGAHLGYQVVERRMAIDELLAQIESGECTELFACGTAAIVSPIAVLADSVTAAQGAEGGRTREFAPRGWMPSPRRCARRCWRSRSGARRTSSTGRATCRRFRPVRRGAPEPGRKPR